MRPAYLIQLILFLLILSAEAQVSPHFLPLHRDAAWLYEKSMQNPEQEFFTAVRPFSLRDLNKRGVVQDTNRLPKTYGKGILSHSALDRKIRNTRIQLNPMTDLNYATGNRYISNLSQGFAAGGIEIKLDLQENLAAGFRGMYGVSSQFYPEGNVYPGPHYDSSINSILSYYSLNQVSGYGLNINRNNDKRYYEGKFSESWISWEPHRFFQVSAGQGKHFFGEGYRSLALSDNAYNYPYLKLSTTFWRLRYTNLFATPDNLLMLDDGNLRTTRKSMAIQMLEFKISSKWYLSFFESIIWERTQVDGNKTWDINYLNPAVFYHPVNYSLNSMGNAMMALGVKYKASPRATLYGQFLLDDFNSEGLKNGNGFFQNKVGGQLGIKGYEIFGAKGLYLQAEMNAVRPYTYGNRQPGINYSHQASPLAHPAGANFLENILIVNYMRRGWTLENKCIFRITGKDYWYTDHYGSNIMLDESNVNALSYGNTFLQGRREEILANTFRVAKLIHAPSMLTIESSFTVFAGSRRFGLYQNKTIMYFNLGMRCQLYNFYREGL